MARVIQNTITIVYNCIKIAWYKTQTVKLYISDWISEHQRILTRSVDYLDNPRYIKADYDDEYDIEDYVKDDKPRYKPYNGPVCETP